MKLVESVINIHSVNLGKVDHSWSVNEGMVFGVLYAEKLPTTVAKALVKDDMEPLFKLKDKIMSAINSLEKNQQRFENNLSEYRQVYLKAAKPIYYPDPDKLEKKYKQAIAQLKEIHTELIQTIFGCKNIHTELMRRERLGSRFFKNSEAKTLEDSQPTLSLI